MFSQLKNSPFVSNQEKQAFQERAAEDKPYQQFTQQFPPQQGPSQQAPQQYTQLQPNDRNKPLVNLQVYPQQPPPKPKLPPIADAFKMPEWAPMPMPFGYPQLPSMYGSNTIMPIIKQYTINTAGPIDDHAQLGRIYEDILPTKEFSNTLETIGERINICNFIRSVIVKGSDGDDISLEPNADNSLMSYIKFMELNPYNTYRFSNNPYRGLPDGMLMYRSCYPIRHDKGEMQPSCAKDSVGLNIRIYKMTNQEYEVNKQKHSTYAEHDIWREVAFYEFIREQILKPKMCPNFAMMYGYFICQKCTIDFDKILIAKGKKIEYQKNIISQVIKKIAEPNGDEVYEPITNPDTAPTVHKKLEDTYTAPELRATLPRLEDLSQLNIPIALRPGSTTTGSMGFAPGAIIPTKISFQEIRNPDAYAKKALIILTEGANYNMYGWNSKIYVNSGNVRKMIQHGYHDEKIWFSILFQLMSAMYAMQIKKIAYENFSLEDNVFIKDLSASDAHTTSDYWKYAINGIEYFVPNYGYLVLVDGNYKDLESTQGSILGAMAPNIKKHKVYAQAFGDDATAIQDRIFQTFRTVFNPNSFKSVYTDNGANPPPSSVLDLLGKMKIDADKATTPAEKRLDYYIVRYMARFMNNRVGTLLKKTEVDNIRNEAGDFKFGDIVVHTERNQMHRFVLYLGPTATAAAANTSQIMIIDRDKNDNDAQVQTVDTASLSIYSRVEPLVQNYKPNQSPIEDNLKEVYTLIE